MLGHLIRKEVLDHILGLRFLILSALGALIISLSLYDGYVYYQTRLRDSRLAQATTQDRIRQITDAGDWSEIASIGYLVHTSPTPMSIFIRGLDLTLGRSIPVVEGGQRLRRSPTEAEPILGVFPPLDLGLVVRVVLSLFVLLLTYDAVCGEKEAGTLRLIASFPAPRDRLLLGKLLGALIPTLAAFGLPLLLGVAVILLMPDAQLAAPEWTRLGLTLLTFALYLAAFVCAGLLASSLTHRTATSFVLLLTFWVATVAVLPRLSLIIADGFQPAPSVYELQAEKKAIERIALQKRNDLWNKWAQDYLKSKGQEFWKTPEGQEAFQIYFSQTRLDARAQTRSQYDRLDETFRNRYNARLDLAIALARLSPAFALNNATVRLAGTGVDRHRRFLESFHMYLEGQRFDWFVRTKDRDMLRQAHPAKHGKFKWDVSDMPRFTYRETWPGEDIRTALVDIGMLAVWGLIFFVGAYVAMLRYDLR